VLFVDEAGQMSLANVLAASQAARSVVLLGDPQQLDQPQRGSHPKGVDVSALEHMHGMEFLYSLNRLNVATSRARCACILVASPRLFEPECK
jgi:superfamily I DNA and/or RNA helicase